jgi:hypothetical protein
LAFIDQTVAIVVQAIADLGGGAFEGIAALRRPIGTRGDCVGANPLAATQLRLKLVDDAVAIVIEPVANLRHRKHGLVDTFDSESVSGTGPGTKRAEIRVEAVTGHPLNQEVLVDLAVAVVIKSVACLGDAPLGRLGADDSGRVRRIANEDPGCAEIRIITVAGRKQGKVLVCLSVAIVVQAIAKPILMFRLVSGYTVVVAFPDGHASLEVEVT